MKSHSFHPSIGSNLCNVCKLNEKSHTALAECDACNYVGPCEIYHSRIMAKDMLLCPDCILKEDTSTSNFINNQSLNEVRKVDYSIKVKDDIFNAEVTSIHELKEIIWADDNIKNKYFELANFLAERLKHQTKVVFDKRTEIEQEESKQRAVQSELNQLVNKLSTEEREKLKLKDMTYNPSVKPISKPKSIAPVKKFDKSELVKYANELGLSMAAIQVVCVKKNMTPLQAAEHLKKLMADNSNSTN